VRLQSRESVYYQQLPSDSLVVTSGDPLVILTPRSSATPITNISAIGLSQPCEYSVFVCHQHIKYIPLIRKVSKPGACSVCLLFAMWIRLCGCLIPLSYSYKLDLRRAAKGTVGTGL
jgi:hypothetical protein